MMGRSHTWLAAGYAYLTGRLYLWLSHYRVK